MPTKAERHEERQPILLPYLDLIVLIAFMWFFRGWIGSTMEPLATYLVQIAGVPLDWLQPLPTYFGPDDFLMTPASSPTELYAV